MEFEEVIIGLCDSCTSEADWILTTYTGVTVRCQECADTVRNVIDGVKYE